MPWHARAKFAGRQCSMRKKEWGRWSCCPTSARASPGHPAPVVLEACESQHAAQIICSCHIPHVKYFLWWEHDVKTWCQMLCLPSGGAAGVPWDSGLFEDWRQLPSVAVPLFKVLLFWVGVGRSTWQNAAEGTSLQTEFLIFKGNTDFWSAACEWLLFCQSPHHTQEPNIDGGQQPRQHWRLWPRFQGQNSQNLPQTPRFSPNACCSSTSNFPHSSQCPTRLNLGPDTVLKWISNLKRLLALSAWKGASSPLWGWGAEREIKFPQKVFTILFTGF